MDASLRVLIIEDDEDDHLITTELLEDIEGTDYEVTWAVSAGAGIEALLANEHDVCLLDFRLGPMTGIDVLGAARADGSRVPCILLTGQDDRQTDRAAAEAGAADYLIKGDFTEADLERAIRYAVGNAAALRSLQESEERFRSVIEAAYDGIVLLDSSGNVLSANRAAHEMFGVAEGMLVDRNLTGLVASSDLEYIARRFSPTNAASPSTGSMEATGVRTDGSQFPMEFSAASWEADGRRYWSAIVRDVTQQRELVGQLEHQAFHDRLTGLANRALLRQRIEHAADGFDGGSTFPALILIDLDDFKRVNDTEGHESGDQLIKMVGKRLSSCVRQGETVARLGGDEFALFVETFEEAHAVMRLAERVLEKLAEPFKIGNRMVTVSGSIGVAMLDRVDIGADELIRNGDLAMYAAKAKGKNGIELFESEMHGLVLDRIRLEEDLALAIENEQITLNYQPLVCLETGATLGFEALARWEHPTRGFVPPPVFIELAERGGLIQALGRMVLSVAVRQASEWQRRFPDEPPIGISVNLSSKQLQDPQLIGFVARLMASSGIAEGSLTLEITESVMVGDVDRAVQILNDLKSLGTLLALDDFGTGYSSLSYLRTLPIDSLKLDRSFILGATDERGLALVEMIAIMGRSLGFGTVAEGIETEDECELVQGFGYDKGQGYYFARPLTAVDATAHLVERHGPGVPPPSSSSSLPNSSPMVSPSSARV